MNATKPISYPAYATTTEDEERLPDARLILATADSALSPALDVRWESPPRSARAVYLDRIIATFKRDVTLWASSESGLRPTSPSHVVVLTARTPDTGPSERGSVALATVEAGVVYLNYALFRDTIPLGFRLAVFTYLFGCLGEGQGDTASARILEKFSAPLIADQVKVLGDPAVYGVVSSDGWLERLLALLTTKLPSYPLPESARRSGEREGANTLSARRDNRGAALSAEQLRYVEEFSARNKVQQKLLVTKMRTLLSILSTALGEDVSIRVAPGEEWAYDPEEGTITFPLIDLVTSSPEQVMGSVFHEVAHHQVTRVNARDPVFSHLLSTESRRLLLATFEDPRATGWMVDTFPGTAPYLDVIYDDLLSEDLSRAPYVYKLQKEAQRHTRSRSQGYRVLPHIEFLLSVLYYWRFGRFPSAITSPLVRQALDSTVRFFTHIFDHHPRGRASEREKRRYAREAAEEITAHILEPYERLLEAAQTALNQTIERGQQPIGDGEDPSEIHHQPLEQEAQETIEAQSKALADRLAAKGTSHQSLDAETLERRVATRQDTHRGAAITEEKPRAELTRQDLVAQRRRLQSELGDSTEEYNRLYARVSGVLLPLVGTLENALAKNRKPKYEGYYMAGQKPDVRKVMDVTRKVQQGLPTARRDFAVFLKRRRPTHLDHRIMLLVDESGSMQEPKRTAVLEGTLLFAEAFEYLELSYAVVGFSDSPVIHKPFGAASSHSARVNLINDVSQLIPGGATADADALALGIELFEQEPEDVFRLMLMISDGEGNVNTTGSTFDALQEAARAKGIRVLGIGIGEAADALAARYAHPIQVPAVAELPMRLGEVLREEVTEHSPHA